MKKLQGTLSISKVHASHEPNYVSLTVTDTLSGCEMVEVKISLEEFASALFSMANRPCEVEFNDSGPIGLKREYKTEVVFVPGDWNDRKKNAKRAVKKFETDGWKGCVEDCENSHRRVGGHVDGGANYTVSFTRYVPVEVKA